MRNAFLLAIAITLTGCADTHQWAPMQRPAAPISTNNTFYISTPADGEYGDNTYTGSGRNTAQIILGAFARKAHSVRIGPLASNYDDALRLARSSGQDILIYPTILHWEDRATEWSMIPDKVEVKIEVIQVNSGDTLSSGIVKGSSGLATLGGDHPQDLLPEPIAEFVAALLR